MLRPSQNTNLKNRSEPNTDPRDVVIRRISRELRNRPDFDFSLLKTDGLSPRDARLAKAIYAECLRRLLTLEYLLNTQLNRPIDQIEDKLRAALLVGACQILFFDHLPDHAVVDETVEWAGQYVRPKAKGLVNAVLRKLITLRGEFTDPVSDAVGRLDDGSKDSLPLGDGRWLELSGKSPIPEDAVQRLSILTSHPTELITRWLKCFEPRPVKELLLHNLVNAPTILVVGRGEISNHPLLSAHFDHRFAIWEGSHSELVEFLRENPTFRVQDPSSFAVCQSTAEMGFAGKTIVDACAGSGTKTHQLASLHPDARIIATDVNDRRRGQLAQRFLKDGQVQVIEPDGLADYAGSASLVLLDVPCSNTGVLARRIEAKYRSGKVQLESVSALQRQIIADTLNCRRDGAVILYSTCALEPIENGKQAEWVCKWHNLQIISQKHLWPAGPPGGSPSKYSDGGYHAIIG